MDHPLVSVLMPAYNCGQYIETAIQAVLDQSFIDFEFIIVNDGSVDDTKKRIQFFDDKRIIYIENEQNSGIVKTLNRGLAEAKGKYILRTDADDIAMQGMVEDLVSFLENAPDHIICGGNMKLINGEKIFTYPSDNDALKIHTLNACPFSHSTVLFRRDILTKNNLHYDPSVQDGEDHALWSDLLPFGKFHNLDRVTLLYRESATQVTAQKKYTDNYLEVREKIFIRHAKTYFSLRGNEIEMYTDLIINRKAKSLSDVNRTGQLIKQLLLHNEKSGLFNHQMLGNFLFIKWYGFCNNAYHLSRRVFPIYLRYLQGDKIGSKIKSVGNQFITMVKS
jgi:glycosyltransferase involved in cell wall biosynthesis